MRRGWTLGGLGAALLAAVLLVPAATGAGPFSDKGKQTYEPRIDGSTSPTAQCHVPGSGSSTFTKNVVARVISGSGVEANPGTTFIQVTASPPPASGQINITAPNQDFPGNVTLPCPPAAQTASVTFTFTPCSGTPPTCNPQSGLAVGTVTMTITNTASA
jgi:hypothetical protein